MLYDLIPNMPERQLVPLIEKFATAVANAGMFTPIVALAKRVSY
jgi:hypothetical protein